VDGTEEVYRLGKQILLLRVYCAYGSRILTLLYAFRLLWGSFIIGLIEVVARVRYLINAAQIATEFTLCTEMHYSRLIIIYDRLSIPPLGYLVGSLVVHFIGGLLDQLVIFNHFLAVLNNTIEHLSNSGLVLFFLLPQSFQELLSLCVQSLILFYLKEWLSLSIFVTVII
jgi:hypothetical protein